MRHALLAQGGFEHNIAIKTKIQNTYYKDH